MVLKEHHGDMIEMELKENKLYNNNYEHNYKAFVYVPEYSSSYEQASIQLL